ncbi:hypothetical protein QY97_01687 [Bacillus thermotolerans]|uniref:Uncharacterized protein n=1 Tax=Bacillus thermotolerans TaxID=1221996 RepID=A0A0F5HQS8_BACTR|nr:hypothetical protein QY97_01687 [Bacillus thermotolerans]KKB39050.1 hypothetical protein QY95_02490 [Bacillus thermotolerans]
MVGKVAVSSPCITGLPCSFRLFHAERHPHQKLLKGARMSGSKTYLYLFIKILR